MSRIYCSNCGRMIPVKSKFCRWCGAPQHGHDASLFQAEKPTVPLHPQEAMKPKKAPKPPKTIPRRHLSPRAKISFFLNYTGRTFIVLIGVAALALLDPLLSAGLLLVYFFLIYAVTTLVFNHFYFSVSKTHFKTEFGIFNRKHVTIPFEQLQNVNIKRTILDQILGLARIDVESAGSSATERKEIIGGSTSLAEGHLPGLALDDAKELHDLLLERVAEAQ